MQPAPQGASGAAEQVVVQLVEQRDASGAAEQVVVPRAEQRDGSLVATPSAGPATASDAVGPQVEADSNQSSDGLA